MQYLLCTLLCQGTMVYTITTKGCLLVVSGVLWTYSTWILTWCQCFYIIYRINMHIHTLCNSHTSWYLLSESIQHFVEGIKESPFCRWLSNRRHSSINALFSSRRDFALFLQGILLKSSSNLASRNLLPKWRVLFLVLESVLLSAWWLTVLLVYALSAILQRKCM